jgi:methionyl-tRNA formyltransferase
MKILFLGQKPIGERCFEILMEYQNENMSVAGAVSNQSCEKVWWKSNTVYNVCVENDLLFIDNSKPNEELIIENIKSNNIDFLVSVGHSWILSDSILKMVSYQAVNLHLAKLPDYKGNYTYNHAILNGEKVYGVTLHWMTDKVDQGDYFLTDEFPVAIEDTAYSLYQKSLEAGVKLFRSFAQKIKEGGEMPRIPMTGRGKFYSRKSLDGLRKINDLNNTEEVLRKSRAFYFPPFENAYFLIDNRKFYIIPSFDEKEKSE